MHLQRGLRQKLVRQNGLQKLACLNRIKSWFFDFLMVFLRFVKRFARISASLHDLNAESCSTGGIMQKVARLKSFNYGCYDHQIPPFFNAKRPHLTFLNDFKVTIVASLMLKQSDGNIWHV